MLPLGLLLALPLGCGAEEPVLQGVPDQAILQARPSASERAARSEDAKPAATYQKPPGVRVDVMALGNRSFRQNRDLLVEQMGALQGVEELPGGAQRVRFAGGEVEVKDDVIYMVRVPFSPPVRRSEALELLGFPVFVGRYLTLHREYRLNNTWGFRRLRLRRVDAESELVDQVEAWHHLPDEPDVIR